MTRDEIDVLWQCALVEAIKAGEQFTRHRFAALVAAHEREECAKVCERLPMQQDTDVRDECAAAIRARGAAPKLCGRVFDGHACKQPAGSNCPDCGPALHDVPEGS